MNIELRKILEKQLYAILGEHYGVKLYKDSYMLDDNYVSKINDTIDTWYVKYNVKNRI